MKKLTKKSAAIFYCLFKEISELEMKKIIRQPFQPLLLANKGRIKTAQGLFHYTIAYYSFRFGYHFLDPEISFLVEAPLGKLEKDSAIYPSYFGTDPQRKDKPSIKVLLNGKWKVETEVQHQQTINTNDFLELLSQRGYIDS